MPIVLHLVGPRPKVPAAVAAGTDGTPSVAAATAAGTFGLDRWPVFY